MWTKATTKSAHVRGRWMERQVASAPPARRSRSSDGPDRLLTALRLLG